MAQRIRLYYFCQITGTSDSTLNQRQLTMDIALVIRQRLDELELDQRDLARAANVTESYVSQILTRKKAPPAPERTDIYDRMDRFLKLPHGQLARVAGALAKRGRM